MVVEQNDPPTEDQQEDNTENRDDDQSISVDAETQQITEATGARANDNEVDEIETLRQQIVALERQVSNSTDKMLRAQAELDNVRKRSARDIENAHKYALDRFLTEFLPVLDSIELGIDAAGDAEDVAALVEGMDLTKKKLTDVLERFGVTVVDPLGEKFNPEKHEAVSMQTQEGVEAGMVVTVMQKGYELNGRLIRPAMVIVSG